MKQQDRHYVRAGSHKMCLSETPDVEEHRKHIEPWLSALCQSEHLSLLVGSGLTTAIATAADASQVNMGLADLGDVEYAHSVNAAAKEVAYRIGRGEPNLEDQLRAIGQLVGGLEVLASDSSADRRHDIVRLRAIWEAKQKDVLSSLLADVLSTEHGIDQTLSGSASTAKARLVRYLGGFLLPFASRTVTRERLHIFTTNYDRLIEYGCDILGLRVIDRFVGSLTPVFRATRLGVDMHYNPPGIRGEPRYLEGVVRFTKLHGSLDWRVDLGSGGSPEVWRCGLPFGAPEIAMAGAGAARELLVYPNSMKDVETLEYPYAELFRDFAAATCQQNSVVFTYGYGFGDDHLNRILIDMLTIPSTHLVIISYDSVGQRLQSFLNRAARDAQITLLVGPHFGDLETLVDHYLPKPAIDKTTWRMVEMLNRRRRPVEVPTEPVAGSTSPDEDAK